MKVESQHFLDGCCTLYCKTHCENNYQVSIVVVELLKSCNGNIHEVSAALCRFEICQDIMV